MDTVGTAVWPYVRRSVETFREFPQPVPGQPGPQWPPRKQLRLALDAMVPVLQDLGWHQDWVADPMKAMGETYKRPVP